MLLRVFEGLPITGVVDCSCKRRMSDLIDVSSTKIVANQKQRLGWKLNAIGGLVTGDCDVDPQVHKASCSQR